MNEKMEVSKKMICRICSSENLEPILELGKQPWANDFLSRERVGLEECYPLTLVYCHDCEAVQLDYTVKKETMFADHTYRSGVTKTLSAHFSSVANRILDDNFPEIERSKIAVLDIGSNDGTQLTHFKQAGCEVLGVESSIGTARYANESGIPTLCEYFNEETAKKINRKFSIINASGVFFHLEELHSVSRAIKISLDSTGVFVVQFLYMKNIVENCAFDQIYHEHLLYYTLKTLKQLLDLHDLEVFDCYHSPIHGGSLIVYAGHPGVHAVTGAVARCLQEEINSEANSILWYKKFSEKIAEIKIRSKMQFDHWRRADKLIYGLGAPVKGNTLLNYFEINSKDIRYLVEKNPLRAGLYAQDLIYLSFWKRKLHSIRIFTMYLLGTSKKKF
jgi:hypothetical protein